ncbi:MAG: LutC/YkgG family protein [Candidatus Kryptoniota bacterium]
MKKLNDREKVFAVIRKRLFNTQKIEFTDDYKTPLTNIIPDNFDGMFSQFKRELEALGGKADQFTSTAELQNAIFTNLKENPLVFITDHILNAYPQVANRLNISTKIIREKDLIPVIPDSASYKKTVNSIDVAITDCLCAIAETGTIVFSGNSRLPIALASQLIIVIEQNQMLRSLDELFTGANFKDHKHSNLFMTTGPSQTADIEKELVKGVHGPKYVFAFFMHR